MTERVQIALLMAAIGGAIMNAGFVLAGGAICALALLYLLLKDLHRRVVEIITGRRVEWASIIAHSAKMAYNGDYVVISGEVLTSQGSAIDVAIIASCYDWNSKLQPSIGGIASVSNDGAFTIVIERNGRALWGDPLTVYLTDLRCRRYFRLRPEWSDKSIVDSDKEFPA